MGVKKFIMVIQKGKFKILVIIKPDAVKRKITGQILDYIATMTKYNIKCLNRVKLSRKYLSEHYAQHQGKFYYQNLLAYMSSNYCYVGYIEVPRDNAEQAILKLRALLGDTMAGPKGKPGTIRADFASINPPMYKYQKIVDGKIEEIYQTPANIAHFSESIIAAEREIFLCENNGYFDLAGVSKRSNETVSSTVPNGFVGSNPAPSID